MYSEGAWHMTDAQFQWSLYTSGVRTLVIRLLKGQINQDGNCMNELCDVSLSTLRGRHSRTITVNCITWKVNFYLETLISKNSGLWSSFLGIILSPLNRHFWRYQRLSHHFALIIKSTALSSGWEWRPRKLHKPPFLDSLLDDIIRLTSTADTTKNSFSRAKFELAFSGFWTNTLPIELSSQLG